MFWKIVITICAIVWVTNAQQIDLPPGFDDAVNNIFNVPNNDVNCTCVEYYLCENGTFNYHGVDVIDIRFKEDKCDNYMQRCCSEGDLREDTNGQGSSSENPIDPSTSSPTPTPPTQKPTIPTKNPRRGGCGHRSVNGVGFYTIGGRDNETQFGEFPWMVGILNSQGNYECGGALINMQAVLTAAHCVYQKNDLAVRAGEWDTQSTSELLPYQQVRVSNMILNNQFNRKSLINDVAILILERPITPDDHVGTICLPPPNTVVTNARCYSTGWGKDNFGKEGIYQVIMKRRNLPMVPNPECQTRLRKTRLGSRFQLHPTFVCAGGEPGVDMCQGDGGGPLVCPIPGQEERYYQVGMVAWGIGCNNPIPAAYVNVARFRDWIDQVMEENDIDSSSYEY